MAQLCQHVDELENLHTQVWLVSFGTSELGRAWLQETCSPFTLLLDPQREAYRAFGLERSLLRSWRPKVWMEYARLLLSGRKWRGIQGDSGQLGGDFIIDTDGIFHMVHPSQDPTDRPPVEELLHILGELKSAAKGGEV